MTTKRSTEEPRRWTGDDPKGGRFDIYGIEWFACDPYPTWFHYDNEDNLVHPADGEYGEPEWPEGDLKDWQTRLFYVLEKAICAVDELEHGWSGKHLTLPGDADAIAGYLCHDPEVLRVIRHE